MSETLIKRASKWVGNIPIGWRLTPLKYVCTYNDETLSDNTDPTFEFDYIDISSVNSTDEITSTERLNFADAPSRARRVVRADDIIMSTVRTYLRAVAIIPESKNQLIASTGFLVIRALQEAITPEYLGYVIKSDSFISAIEAESIGVSYPAINASEAVKNYIPVPPLDVQRSIVAFLDSRCKPLNEAIARHRMIIDKLEDYRKAVISHTVAGDSNGLDNTRWTWKRFKFIAHVDSNLVEPDNYQHWLHISPESISKGNGRLLRTSTVYEDGVTSCNHLFHKGAILYSKVRPRLNKVIIAPDDGLCSADMYPISTSQFPEWLKYYMLSDQFVEQAGLVSDIRIKMPKINQQELGNLKVFVPPRQDQLEIISQLDYKCAAIDEGVDRQEQVIARLEEYRRSLIFHAVTGRIDCMGGAR
ncbi:restriction endonuclease subunit S [Bifidobacterium pseudolongum]|uniref:restriction endonuclease subunit S n=1 Tax=Bifidobacterium pseudolongum TaxID=1694 RepID=UPI00102037D6|nr:restriction endonuclease subunit S [Bifidobacterium pseudolongum]RYQ72979.1 type I restriction-modification system RcaSBIP subunit S [Bifidobacterium pseudolongum subsp. globosum]